MNKRNLVIEYISDLIERGELKKGDKIPSEYTLSEKLSVNKKTANLAVNSMVERGLLKRLVGAAGTIVANDISYPKGTITYLTLLGQYYNFWTKMLRGAQRAALGRNYALQYIEYDPAAIQSLWEKLSSYGIKGLLTTFYGLITVPLPFPVMHLGYTAEGDTVCNNLSSDHIRGGEMITKHLLEMSHRELVFVGDAQYSDRSSLNARKNGFLNALREASVNNPEERVFFVNSNYAALMQEIRSKFSDISGIVFDSDILAIRMSDFFLKSGIRIPEDLSISGYGAITKDMPTMKITSIEQYPEDMGFHACNLLIDIIENKRREPVSIKLPVEVFPGASAGIPCNS